MDRASTIASATSTPAGHGAHEAAQSAPLHAYAAHRFGVNTVDIEGFTFLDLDEQQFAELIVRERLAGRGGWVVTPNLDILRKAHVSPEFRVLLHRADVLVADGMPLIWASRIKGTPLKSGRICGSDLIYSIPKLAAQSGLSIFLLGGVDDRAERACNVLCSLYPGLRIAGTYSPPFGFERDQSQYERMREEIARARPDIIFVCLGVPKSERLIQVIREAAPQAWWIGVGAALDFVSGALPRAPKIMQRTGTEWLFRMLHDPKRLVRRYLLEDLPYLAVLLRNSLMYRLGVKRRPPATAATLGAPTVGGAQNPAQSG